MSANSSITAIDAQVNGFSLAASVGSDSKRRPVHHSEIVCIQASKTRPADTTAYAAGDAMGAAADVVFTFDLHGAGMSGALIVGGRVLRNDTSNTSMRLRAYVFDASPTIGSNADNAAYSPTWNNRMALRGWIDFSAPVVGSDYADFAGAPSNAAGIPVAPASGDGVVRVVLVTLDAFTPASGSVNLVELDFVA